MSDLSRIGRSTPDGTLIRPELAQALEDFRDAFVRWAIAAYADAGEPATKDEERTRRLAVGRAVARKDRDDKAIEMVAALFTWGSDPESTAYDAIDADTARGH